MKWILKHLRLFAALVVFGITFIIVGITILVSYTSYKDYEKKYYQNDLDTRSNLAAAPKVVEINDNFKSKYKTTLTAYADNMTYTTTKTDYAPVTGDETYLPSIDGKINVALKLEEKSFVDIDFVINCATDNLLGDVSIKVNDSLIEEDGIKVEKEGEGLEWHHVVMRSFALPQGDLTIEIASVKGKTAPDLKNITFYANAALSFAQAA